MTRKTRSQAKAKAKASASQQQSHDIVTAGNCVPMSAINTCATPTSSIVREVDTQTNRQVRFMTSESVADRGFQHKCKACDGPINTERSVQCQKCTNCYHSACIRESTDRLEQFTCESCAQRFSAPPALSSCGRSSTSSTRRARLARELALLEEERRLEEEARKEQLDRERLMNERAVNEKIERDKQYLARKRDLLIQQDEEDDIVSIRSHRSTHSTEKRIEDWIDTQEKPTSDAGTGVVGETSKPSAPTHHTPVKSAGAHGQQSTSTPIRDEQITNSEIPMKREPSNFIDLMSPTGSITIGESDPGEAAGGNSQVDDNLLSPAISLVNLNSLQNLLEEQKPIVHHTGALPKLARNALLPYGQWQRDTALRRKTNELEQRHQSEIDTRRRRELDLVDEIKRLQLQKDSDIEKFRKHEADTQKRLQEFSDRQTALELRRHEELQQRDTEIRRLKDAERRLTDQLNLFSQKRERDGAIEVNNVPAHMEQQQPERTNQPRGPIGTKGFVIDPSPVSAAPLYPTKTNTSPPQYQNYDLHPPISMTFNKNRSPPLDHILPPLINHPTMPATSLPVGSPRLPLPGHHEVFCPSPEQLAARQSSQNWNGIEPARVARSGTIAMDSGAIGKFSG
nr:uncharacterized protein LOC115261797 [Aedes albopictus]